MWVLVVAIITSSILTAAFSLLFIRWVKSKQRRARIPSPIIEEMNEYAEKFQRIVTDMRGLTSHIRSRRSRNRRIIENLRSMNQILQSLHRMFEEEITGKPDGRVDIPQDILPPHEPTLPHNDRRESPNEDSPGLDSNDNWNEPDAIEDHTDGFSASDQDMPSDDDPYGLAAEKNKFHQLPRITENEIRNIDWDELQRRFTNET